MFLVTPRHLESTSFSKMVPCVGIGIFKAGLGLQMKPPALLNPGVPFW